MTEQEIYDQRDKILIRIDERTRAIPRIEKHLSKLNGSVSEAMLKACLADDHAKEADRKAVSASSRHDSLMKVLLGSFITAWAAVIYLIFEVWLDVI